MKISFITTIFNEKKTIKQFLDSLISQTKLPDEIIIVDGMSTDKSVDLIKNYESRIKEKKVKFKILVKPGNRSVGRNEAVKTATGDIIVCSDAGNILDKNWIKNITKPFQTSPQSSPNRRGSMDKIDVVAGYYKGRATNIFQKCLIPYVLVMPDKVDEKNFLPATRSVAFRKSIWKKTGGFDEKLSHNEDYVFARKLKKIGAKIVFAKDAIVNWIPRNNFKEAFIMFFRFALGDAEARIFRTKVLLLIARYFLGLYFIFLSYLYKSFVPLVIIISGIMVYLTWSVRKNYKYVKDKRAFVILPLLQFISDVAVLSGTLLGIVKGITGFNYYLYMKQNKFLFFILSVYVLVLLLTLDYGIPNKNHPFPYNMDEWHQLQAVANTYRYGTPNTFGSANGTMFHFLLSGFYLIPFILLKIINPFILQIDNAFMRERVFEVLRLQTIFFGALSIITFYKIADFIKVSKKLVITLFVFTPLWLSLSNFFKYDIALLFWILLSMLFFLRFCMNPTNRNFIIAAVPAALTLAVKVSAVPIFLIYIFSYFWFHPQWKKNFKVFFIGIGLFMLCLIFFGLPDTVFGKGNILLYFWENVIQAPATSGNYNLGMPSILYLFVLHYPMIFGHGFMFLLAISILFKIYFSFREGVIKTFKKYKVEVFIYFSLIMFILSLIPLQVLAAANRSLVVLPFFVLIIVFVFKKSISIPKLRLLSISVIVLVIVIQVFESFSAIYTKVMRVPRETSSIWIEKNITQGQIVGIENIPIYQAIPDVIQKEFYFNQYQIKNDNRFKYEIIDSKAKVLPSIIVVSDDELELRFIKNSSKKDLVKRLNKEEYKKLAVFSPDLKYYNIFNHPNDYYFYAWLTASPLTISIYAK